MRRVRAMVAIAVLVGSMTGCGTLDRFVEGRIEEVGTEVTGVTVAVEEVEIKLRRAWGKITGLTVANPEGYAAGNAIEVDLALLDLGLFASIGGDPVVVDELVLVSPVVSVEFRGEGESNLREIFQSEEPDAAEVDEAAPEAGDEAADDDPADEEPDDPTRIAIRELRIEDVTLEVRRADGTTRSATLPAIELSDVGGDEGATPVGLAEIVVAAMVNSALRQAVAARIMEGDLFDAGRLLALLDRYLDLSDEQMAEVRPVVSTLCDDLNRVVEVWVEEGFVDLTALREDLEPAFERSLELLRGTLDEGQVEKLTALLSDLKEAGVETIGMVVVSRLADAAGIRPEQLTEVMPVLRTQAERLGDLVARVKADPDMAREVVQAEYAAIRADVRRALARVLSPEELTRMGARLDAAWQAIEGRLFAGD